MRVGGSGRVGVSLGLVHVLRSKLLVMLRGELVLVRVRALLGLLLGVVVGEVEIGTSPRAKIEVKGHAGQEKGGSP